MARKPKTRLFSIAGSGDEFVTGVCDDGRRVVMGLLCPDVTAAFFDGQGAYLGCEERRWSAEAAKLAGQQPPYMLGGERFRKLIAEQMEQWRAELGFRAATIQVQQFWASGTGVGIEELPGWARESRAEWLESGCFVWWWAKDYYMSKDGKVVST